jgi:hypothetical protein
MNSKNPSSIHTPASSHIILNPVPASKTLFLISSQMNLRHRNSKAPNWSLIHIHAT